MDPANTSAVSPVPAPVDPGLYSTDYYLERCGGIEFFRKFGFGVLTPPMQAAVLAADLKPGHRILDIGCGRGELVAHLSEKGFQAQGWDYSPDAIALARKVYPKGRYQVVNAASADFGADRFDRLFVLGTIEHLHDYELDALLKQVDRVLDADGCVVLTTCVNKLYYKVWTYRARRGLALVLRRLGFAIRDPLPPRTDEDESLHINELSYFDLKKRFSSERWVCRIWPQANPKLTADRLYPAALLESLQLELASAWKRTLYRWLVFRLPLSLLLARSYLVRLERRS